MPCSDRALLHAIKSAWSDANWTYLGSALQPPVFDLFDHRGRLGEWVPATRTIRLSRQLARQAPWEQVTEVLRHEMAHQFVDEVLRVGSEAPHGSAFQHALQRLAVDPIVAGMSSASPDRVAERAMDRARKLLALAGSDNQHEAEAAMAAARRIMMRHDLDRSDGSSQYTSRVVGPRRQRFQLWEKLIIALLSQHFFVHAVWVPVFLQESGRTGRAAELLGTPAHLELAAWVHDFLRATGARLWKAHSPTRRVQHRADRASFLAGVVRGFDAKLRRQRELDRETGLVWVADADLGTHVAARHPKLTTRRGRRARHTIAYNAGHAAGQSIVLHRPVATRSTGSGGAPRLTDRRRM